MVFKSFRKILLIIILFFAATRVSAQETSPVFDFNRAYQDYIYTVNQYLGAHTDYVAARQAYLTYKTLTVETEAQEKTLKMLQFRDEVIRTYLTAIRTKLAEATGISNYEQNLLYLKIDDDVVWYSNHKELLTSAGSIPDLVQSARSVESRYPQSELYSYTSLGTIIAGREKLLTERLKEKIPKLREKIIQLKDTDEKDITKFERWLLEAENKITRSEEKQNKFEKDLKAMTVNDGNKEGTFKTIRVSLEEANVYLQEASLYLKEIASEMDQHG